MNVVTRIAPSPTGRMHIGTARVALFNYLWARHNGGKFILRIEDTDPARDKPEFEADIRENIAWLGIKEDEFHRQSENKSKHADAIQSLVAKGSAYVSREPAKDDPTRAVEVVRFKNPNTTVTFRDELRGDIRVHTADLGDFVIARSLTDPIHHLAVVVDDALQGVTLAMRGEDLLPNTPRQILIQDALGLPRPQYLHLPLILAPDRTKLSKRRHATSVGDFKTRGYLSGGLVNFLAFLGWNPGGEKELYTMDELIADFSIEKIQKSGAIFNEEKLNWLNRAHMLRMEPQAFWEYAQDFLTSETQSGLKKGWEQVAPIMRERASTFGDVRDADAAGEYAYFYQPPALAPQSLLWKQESKEATKERLESVLSLMREVLGSQWTGESVKNIVWPYAERVGRGQVLWPMRVALSGREKSPDPFVIAGIIGKDETENRIAAALGALAV